MQRISWVLAIVFLAAGSLGAQTFRGAITGSVTDASGATIEGASVKAVNTGTGLTRDVTATASGEFSFQDLPLGSYAVTVSHTGFQTVKVDRVEVEVGKVTALTVKLNVATQATTVEVTAAIVALDTDSTAVNSVIPDQAVQQVPLNGRDFTQLIKLAPGVNGAGSLNGGRTVQNNWQIDGADNNDLWHNSAAVNQGGVSGVAGTLLPIEAIDQFSVQSSANAESGRNGAGSFNMVIKSGTNSIHGSLYYFNRNDALAVETPFAPPGSAKPKLKNNQFGGSVGGPILKNKLFYFLTYERQKFIVGNVNSGYEPSNAWVTEATGVLQQYNIPVNPVSLNLLNAWPARGRTGPATTSNFFSTDDSDNYSDNVIGKIDYNINERNNIAFRYFVGTGQQTAPVGSPYHEYYQVAPSRMQNGSLVYNTVITPKLVNQVLAGVNYFKQTFNDFDTSFNPIAAGLNTGVTNPSLLGTPNIAIGGFDQVGLTPPLGRIDTTGHIDDNLTYTIGTHQIRVGAEYRRARCDVFYQRNGRGTFTFDGTQGPWSGNSAISSDLASLSDFLAGYVSSSSISFGDRQRNYYANDFDWFIQDSWKARPNLTVNYGLRWDYFGPFYDPTNRISDFIPSKGGIVYTGHGIDSLYPKRFGNFGPRLGVAYTPNNKWVIRANYGIFYDRPNLNAFADNRPPDGGASGVLANPGSIAPVYSLTRSNYTIVSSQPLFGSGTIPPPPYGLFSVNQDFKNAYLMNFGMNAQYQLGGGAVFQLGYVGSEGRHLLTTLDINQAPLSPLGTAAQRSVQNTLRPYYAQFPDFAAINEVNDIGSSNYNSLQASLRTSSWHGVTSQFSYTYGHSLDDVSAVRGVTPENSNNLKMDYASSDFDVRHTFTDYVSYNLPAFNGPRRLVQGWQLNTLMSFYSGLPVNVVAGKNITGTFEGNDRPDLVGDPYSGTSTSLGSSRFAQILNPAAFALPAPGTYGNLGRNAVRGPGFASVDFSIVKSTPITERIGTQFRVEMFNLFNHTNLAPPSSSISSGNFGRSTDTIGDYNGAPGIGAGEPFNVQLALKVIF